MDSIEAGSAAALGDKIPFTSKPALYNEPGQYAPHVDGGMRGLSIHHNKGNLGSVEIAHLLNDGLHGYEAKQFSGTHTGDFNQYEGGGIEEVCADLKIGDIHTGELKKDRLTVFSQGNLPGLYPAIHYFKRDPNDSSWSWTRYSSSAGDTELSKLEVLDRAKHYRLGLQISEYHGVYSDKNMMDYWAKNETREPIEDVLMTRFRPDEIDEQIRTHPGKNIRSLGYYQDSGIIRFQEMTRTYRAAQCIAKAILRK